MMRPPTVLSLIAITVASFLVPYLVFATSIRRTKPAESNRIVEASTFPQPEIWWKAAENLKGTGCEEDFVTDKITGPTTLGGHMYHIMYAIFLMPLRYQDNAKMLEIGLGCGMAYGAGASAKLWRRTLPNVELWEADVNAPCLQHHKKSLQEMGVHTLHGDQSSEETLKRWLHETGGGFDAIIDDGSHRNSDIMNTFDLLWPSLNAGGVYFLEDLHVGRATDATNPVENYEDTNGKRVVSEVMQAWIEQKLIVYPPLKFYHGGPVRGNDGGFEEDMNAWEATESNKRSIMIRELHPMPIDVAFVFCQAEACVIGKEPPKTEKLQSCANAEQSSGKDNS